MKGERSLHPLNGPLEGLAGPEGHDGVLTVGVANNRRHNIIPSYQNNLLVRLIHKVLLVVNLVEIATKLSDKAAQLVKLASLIKDLGHVGDGVGLGVNTSSSTT